MSGYWQRTSLGSVWVPPFGAAIAGPPPAAGPQLGWVPPAARTQLGWVRASDPLGAAQLGRTAAPQLSYRTPRLQEHDPKGIEGRIDLLRRMVGESIRDPEVSRKLALRITSGCGWRNDQCELAAIWDFMHRNVRYTGDIYGYDTFQTARNTLDFRGGDCDDGFTLIATLCMGNQFAVKGRITSNPGEPKQWAHIYPMVGIPKVGPTRWFPLDWTLGYSKFGAHPPQARHLDFDAKNIVESPSEIGTRDYLGGW